MTIAVNGIYLKHNATGIANVLIKTVNVWSDWKDVKVIIFLNTEMASTCAERLDKRIEIKILPMPFLKTNSTLWFLLKFASIINKESPDLLWCPAPWIPFGLKSKQKVMISVHDFVSKEFKSTMRFSNRIITGLIEKHSVKRADFFWVVSNYTYEKLCEYYPVSCRKTFYIGSGTDDGIKELSECDCEERIEMNKEFDISKPYMLFIGTLEPRKNLKFLLSIYPSIYKEVGLDLVVVGAKGWGNTGIKTIVETETYPIQNVHFTGYVSDKQLARLYSGAELFISTSLNEGFGLPQVEAMSCGCPVVVAKNSAMTEVSEGAGVLVEGWMEKDWINAVKEAICRKEEIVKRQYERVKKYQWTNVMSGLQKFLTENGVYDGNI